MTKVLLQNPPCYLLKGDAPLVKIRDASVSELEVGPEESVAYDFQQSGYIYGEPIDFVQKDKDGFLMRKRSRILTWDGQSV